MWDFFKKFIRTGIWTYPLLVALMAYAVTELEDIWSIPQNVGLFLRYIFPGICLAAINLPDKGKKKTKSPRDREQGSDKGNTSGHVSSDSQRTDQ